MSSGLEFFDDCSPNKRFKVENEFFSHSLGSPNSLDHVKSCQSPQNIALGADQKRPFDGLKLQQNECAVKSQPTDRHLFLPQYSTAVNVSNDELLTNGDSGFQDINAEDRVSETNSVKNELVEEPDENVNDTGSNESNEFDDDDNISFSGFSDISDMSSENWRPVSNHIQWVNQQIENGIDPKGIIENLTGKILPEDMNDISAWRIILRMLSEPVTRSKLPNINTIDDVISLIQKSSKIIVLTGAGVSVSCGIPDFRSRNGIYARLSKDYPDLPDPQAMFDIHYFKRNPCPFFKFAKEVYPGQFAPSPSHKFIKFIEKRGKLLRNYSQNIDTLEKTAEIENVVTCHGSFATATCTNCGYKVDSCTIKEDIIAQRIPLCTKCCNESEDSSVIPVMKPDIVFFGEGLSDDFHNSMTQDKDECDLLIVIGSSLKVRPVALIPSAIPENIPQILINREPLSHLNFDVELLGDCDVIIKHLCQRLGSDWLNFCFSNDSSSAENSIISDLTNEFDFFEPCRYVFSGAEVQESRSSDSDDYGSGDENEISPKNETNSEGDESNLNDCSTHLTAVPTHVKDFSIDLNNMDSLVTNLSNDPHLSECFLNNEPNESSKSNEANKDYLLNKEESSLFLNSL